MKITAALTLFIALALGSMSAFADTYIDMTVDDAVSIALTKNRDIQDAFEETQRAKYQITEAASAAYPQISGLWDYNKNLKPQVFVIQFPDSSGVLRKNRLKMGTDNTMNLGASLTQPIWVGGKVGTALKAAKIYKKISDETFKSVQQNVASGVATSFFGILLAEEVVNITRESLEQAQKHLANVESLKKAGSATEYDLLRARVQVSNLKPGLMDAENNVALTLLRFKELLGLDPKVTITIKGALAAPDTSMLSLARHETALQNRPEFRATRQNIDLRKKAVRLAIGDFLPTLSAGTTFAYNGMFDIFKYTAGDWSPYWFANVSLTIPLFTGFKNKAKLAQAKVDLRKAQTSLIKTRDSISIEVEESVMNLRKAVNQIESQRMNVSEAEKAFEIAGSLFSNGKVTQLEVLDVQLALEVSKTNLVTALYEGKVAEISLKRSLGLYDADSREETLQ